MMKDAEDVGDERDTSRCGMTNTHTQTMARLCFCCTQAKLGMPSV